MVTSPSLCEITTVKKFTLKKTSPSVHRFFFKNLVYCFISNHGEQDYIFTFGCDTVFICKPRIQQLQI